MKDQMKVLIAEDDAVASHILLEKIDKWGFDTVLATDGNEAWRLLQTDPEISIALIDWMMPGMDGLELCRRIRKRDAGRYVYVIMLTALSRRENLMDGLSAGADEYITKPFDSAELKLRFRSAQRIIKLERSLARKISELHHTLDRVTHLEGLLPICVNCHQVRDEEEYWHEVDLYLAEHTDARPDHTLCPRCLAELRDETAGFAGQLT